MQQKQIIINNKLGLHARAAAKFVTLASSFSSAIDITKDHQTVNGKSIMGVMMLAAEEGSTIVVRADGPDEEQAITVLAELVNGKFGGEP